MRVDLLGALAVTHQGSVEGRHVGGRRAQLALALLALSPGSVPAEQLAEALWGEQPPPTWRPALRGIVRGLRDALAPIGLGGEALIATVPGGYALVDSAEVDVVVAAECRRRGEALLLAGQFSEAADSVEPGSRVSGAQLLPGEDQAWLTAHRRAIDQTRFDSLRIIAEAASGLNQHARAIDAARLAVELDPLNERAHQVLIAGLDRAGDRAGAVRAYEQCRTVLGDELGIDPSSETVELYLSALRDRTLLAAGRLPTPTAAMVGRSGELIELRDALQSQAIVTVTGKGGVGKSRLALQAASASSDFPGGRRWVSLAAVSDNELVAATVALELGMAVGPDNPDGAIAAELAPLGRALLVLDGCEATRDGVASLVSALLMTCRELAVLVTSRSPIGLEGEKVLMLQPFAAPTPMDLPALAANDSVQLLVDRVTTGGGMLEVEAGNAPLVAALCTRCGGLPLALELAAAQLTVMSLTDLLEHLTVGGDDDQVRAVLERSYALLDPDEAEVFRTFAILDGAVGLPLVRRVVSEERVAPMRVIRVLRELTAAGLMWVDRSGARWRYQMDDDVRRFASDRLVGSGAELQAFGRLADAIRGVLPENARTPPSGYQDEVLDMIGSVRSYLGAAIDGRADPDRGLELAFRLHRFWAATNVAEGRFWLSRLLAQAPSGEWNGYATFALGYLTYWAGDADVAVTQLESAAEALRGKDVTYTAHSLIYLAGLLDDLDRVSEALTCVDRAIEASAQVESVDLQVAALSGVGCVLGERADPAAATHALHAAQLCREGGTPAQLAAVLSTAAMVCWQAGEFEQARALVAEAEPLHRDNRRIARVVWLSVAAALDLERGDVPAALDCARRADEEGTALGVERELPLLRCVRALACLANSDLAEASAHAQAALKAAQALTYTFPVALCLETAAAVLDAGLPGSASDPTGLATLLAAADAIRTRGDRPIPLSLRRHLDGVYERYSGSVDSETLDAGAATRYAIALLEGDQLASAAVS
ncbi:MAG TPA: BTAD domain-containing putative transcriptional regulator [Frankiaceae bacterium]|nr:BTAD domain-containing putative transcriptional regulator [Frankiaceae bacterium]